jgi:hypothetical protein
MSYRPTNLNLPDAIKGDTWDGIIFTVKVNDVAVDLGGSTIITMDMRLTPTGVVAKNFTTVGGGGITILSPTSAGKFQLDPWDVDIDANIYCYDIQILFDNGETKTYIGGNFEIIQDVTYS